MHVVDKVMVWLGFERDLDSSAESNAGKILYRKRGVDVVPDQNFHSPSSQGQAAARAHVSLTLFDKAVLWIFDHIVSPLMSPPTSPARHPVMNTVPVNIHEIDDVADQIKKSENLLDGTKAFIKPFLDKETWPTSGQVFSEGVRKLANSHWSAYQNLPDKSVASDDERLTYAAAAYALGKVPPSFDAPEKAESAPPPPPPPLPRSAQPETDTKEVFIVEEPKVPQASRGEIVFADFVRVFVAPEFKDLNSLDSPYFDAEAFDHAKKIVSEDQHSKKTFTTPPSFHEVNAAKYLTKRKTILEGKSEEALRRQEQRAHAERIDNEKKQLRPGEWAFREFVKKFTEHKDGNRRFVLQSQGKYLRDDELLAFAALIKEDELATEDQKSAADYLGKWRANPEGASKEAMKKETFSFPPEPEKPSARRVKEIKTAPPPIPPEQRAVSGLLGADQRQRDQILRLIRFDAAAFRSALDVLGQIWPAESTSDVREESSHPLSGGAEVSYDQYTDLEQADNALALISVLAKLNTGHNIALSAAIDAIKENQESIVRRLTLHRSGIIQGRKIMDVAEMKPEQLTRGQQRFEEFRATYAAASERNTLDQLIMRDIYLSEDCLSYASHMQIQLSSLLQLTEVDTNALQATAFLLNKYHQLRSMAGTVNDAEV